MTLINLSDYEKRVYSQNGEDGIIERIFQSIGTTNKYYVEFGTEDGVTQCNTRNLREKGWSGLLMDCAFSNPAINLHKEFITRENINELFDKYSVPQEPDLISIDVDGNDYWLWQAINRKPRVVVIEYNMFIPDGVFKVIKYDPNFKYKGDKYFGASIDSMRKLGQLKGYAFVGLDSLGINSFFVRNDLLKEDYTIPKRSEPKPIYNRPEGRTDWEII